MDVESVGVPARKAFERVLLSRKRRQDAWWVGVFVCERMGERERRKGRKE